MVNIQGTEPVAAADVLPPTAELKKLKGYLDNLLKIDSFVSDLTPIRSLDIIFYWRKSFPSAS